MKSSGLIEIILWSEFSLAGIIQKKVFMYLKLEKFHSGSKKSWIINWCEFLNFENDKILPVIRKSLYMPLERVIWIT